MSDPTWTWDPARQAYYYWSEKENCFVYQNSDRLYLSPQGGTGSPASADPRTTPGYHSNVAAHSRVDSHVSTHGYKYSSGGSDTAGVEEITTGLQYQSLDGATSTAAGGSAQQGYQLSTYSRPGYAQFPDYQQQSGNPASTSYRQPSAYGQAGGVKTIDYGQQSYDVSASYGQQPNYATSSNPNYPGSFVSPTYGYSLASSGASQTTYAAPLPQSGSNRYTSRSIQQADQPVRYILRGTGSGDTEPLDPNFKKQRNPADFFKVGKVFKILWPELAGDDNPGVTVVSAGFGERVATKIRWFVVIRKGNNYCSCLPIATYRGQGVAKPSVVKNHHAIIHTSKTPPPARKSEQPQRQADNSLEYGMRDPVRVKPVRREYRMDSMSRLNYAKIYTVEHNVKVFDFGDVHKDSLNNFTANFQDVWAQASPSSDEDNDDDGDEDQE